MAWAKADGLTDYFERLPAALRENLLRGALREMAKVVAAEAKQECTSDEVRGTIRVTSAEEGTKLVSKVQCKGKGAFIALWLEWGTAPHLIRVDPRDTNGVSVSTVNRRVKEGSLVINGRFVGPVVEHPGAQAHPFFFTAFDHKRREAIAAGQAYLDRRLAQAGPFAPPEADTDQ